MSRGTWRVDRFFVFVLLSTRPIPATKTRDPKQHKLSKSIQEAPLSYNEVLRRWRAHDPSVEGVAAGICF